MPGNKEHKKTIVDAIKHQIRVLNGIVLLIVYALLFLIVRFMYVFLDYLSTPSLVAILSILAGLVVIGMYIANKASKNAIKTISEYADKLNIFLNTTRDIREILLVDVLLENIVDYSLKITGADAGALLLVEGDKLIFKVVRGSESSKLVGLSIPKPQGICGWVLENNAPVRINNVKNDIRFNSAVDEMTGYETRSILSVPLRLSSGIIGVLELLNKRGGDFTSDEEDLISYFADQAAIAIDRAKFFEDQKNYEIHLTDIMVETMDNNIHEKTGHSKRVAKYSLLMARALNMSENEKKKLYRACLLHDIGFLKIRLTDVSSPSEYRMHSQLGYDMLRLINFYADIAPVVLHHHEHYNGNGYPSGQKSEEIPLESRIIAIAEAFDAMANKNSYKYIGKRMNEKDVEAAYGFKKAIEELKNNAGTQFDPELIDIFVRNIDESLLE